MLDTIDKLKNVFETLPGVGNKSALRMALHFIEMDPQDRNDFLHEVRVLSEEICICDKCHAYSTENPCIECKTGFNDNGILCVVEMPMDVIALRRFVPGKSKFHVLGGKLSPLNGVLASDLNIETLKNRFSDKCLKEVILANSSDVEGEATASFLKNLMKGCDFKVSRISFGISVGGSLNNSDERSIQKSLSDRMPY